VLVYATVRRWFSPAAGLIAGTVVALTPVAALMFRFNNHRRGVGLTLWERQCRWAYRHDRLWWIEHCR
jgi:4-amino-4-deoxy-L-arabinose transferase-like glycosyltransferase